MTNKYTLERANNYIKNNTVVKDFYPKVNFAAPVGWINDPNGVCIFKNELHLFYQHYPYDSVHGKMHWGHAKSKDGYHWEDLDVALAPDQVYDKDGVFSGSAIEKDGKLYLMYTGHIINEAGEIRETQNIAISEDGIKFEKYKNNPVLDEKDVPEGSSIQDFRDPKVFKKEDKYYAVIGSKTNDERGQVLLYESDDLFEWKFKSIILPYNEFLGDMVECPDLLLFEDKDAFLLSAMNYTDKDTGEFYPHISWIIEGKVDWTTFVFDVDSIRKMDGGFDFYAPQTALISSDPNEYIGIAWQQAWHRTLPSHDLEHKWSGQMTMPRIIKEQGGEIIQKPYSVIEDAVKVTDEVEEYHLETSWQNNFEDNYIEFEIDSSEKIKLLLSNSQGEDISMTFDGIQQQLNFSRENTLRIEDIHGKVFNRSSYPIPIKNKKLQVKIFIDVSSIQIFINNDYTFTSTFYTKMPLDLLTISSESNPIINNLKIGKLQ